MPSSLIFIDTVTIGRMLIGCLLSMSLWGVSCAQTYEYFLNNTDRMPLRSIIALLWMLDTLSSAMDCNLIYYLMVTTFDDETQYVKSCWGMIYRAPVTGIVNLIIRTMFAKRIYHFSGKNVLLPLWIVGIAIADFGIDIASVYVALHIDTDPMASAKIHRFIYTTFCLGFVADISITAALCWLLQSAKTGFHRSNNLVNVLMIYTVNTGLLVTVDALASLITFSVVPSSLAFDLFLIWSNKLYFNAYLATLNARERLRRTSNMTLSFSEMDVHSDSHVSGRISEGYHGKKSPFRHQPMAVTLQSKTTIVQRADDVSCDVKMVDIM